MPDIIRQICEEHGYTVTYKTYRMWHNVPHINNTALVVDEYVSGGGQRLLYNCYPSEVTSEMIISAIEADAYSIGRLLRTGKRQFIPWYNLIGDTPPGYHTHRIGSDVSCK